MGSMTLPIFASKATCKIGTTVTTVATSDTLANQVTQTDYSGYITNLSITGGTQDVSAVNLFSGQMMNENRADVVTVELTMLFNDYVTASLMFGTATIGTSTASTYYRMAWSEKFGNRVQKAILLTLDSGQITNILINDAVAVGRGDISLSADGYVELKMTFKALVGDCYEESNTS